MDAVLFLALLTLGVWSGLLWRSVRAGRGRTEAELGRLRSALSLSSDGIAVCDAAGRLVYANASEAALFGYAREQLLGKSWQILYEPAQRERFEREILPQLHHGGQSVWTGRVTGQRRDGTAFQQELTVALLREGGMVFVGRNVSPNVPMDDELLRGQRMEIAAQLAAATAHEFSNLITAIGGHASLASREAGPDHRAAADVGRIQEAVGRAAALTRRLLAFSGKHVLEPTILDAGRAILDMRAMLEGVLHSNVTLSLLVDEGVGNVRMDPTALQQVLLNLAINAREAMPDGGSVVIGVARSPFGPEAAPHLADEYVKIWVRDSGRGMSPEVLARAFEPFFTTKPPGRGAGIGLYTVQELIRRYGGDVTIASEPDKGTTVRIFLPLERGQAEPEAAPVSSGTEGSETILLVEDDPAVRSVASRALQAKGYVMLPVEDAEAALELASRSEAPIDLLLSDVVLPGLTGPELAHALREERPELAVVFISGYSEELLQSRVVVGDATFLSKPFTIDVLAATVRRALDGRRASGGRAVQGVAR